MVSGIGFQSSSEKDNKVKARNKTVSKGTAMGTIFLLITIAAWFFLDMKQKSLEKEVAKIENEITAEGIAASNALSDEIKDIASRSYTMEKELYRGYDSNDILEILEKSMIKKSSDDSGNRVVLKSYQYSTGSSTKKQFKDGDATIKSLGSVTITADADTFDVMAQQIETLKNVGYVDEEILEIEQLKGDDGDDMLAKKYYFDNVKIGTTDRDDSGRIIFTLTMDVNRGNISPFEDKALEEIHFGIIGEENVEIITPTEDITQENVGSASDEMAVDEDTQTNDNTEESIESNETESGDVGEEDEETISEDKVQE
ncbi:MAG: hypothetical protein ACKUBY_01350 [Candidatus Moraniibacteriota bacterium]|jgi:hypothetical protein